jgi:hypothetical protein
MQLLEVHILKLINYELHVMHVFRDVIFSAVIYLYQFIYVEETNSGILSTGLVHTLTI